MKTKFATFLLLGLPVVVFFVFVFYYAVNIGYADDFHGIEGFLASWMQQETWRDKAHLLFSQMCEHRILYGRSSTWLCYQIFGEINYKLLMFTGVAYLLLLPFIFYRVLRELNLGLAYLVPVMFIVFNIQPIENIFWAMTALQPNITIIFGLWALSLLLFTQKPFYFYFAAFLCFVAMFTNGNGMFSYLAAIPIVLYTRPKNQKVQWFLMIALNFILYFYNYKNPGIRPDVGQNFTKYPHLIVGDFFAFFGSPIDSTVQVYNVLVKNTTAIVVGMVLTGWLAVLLFTFIYFQINSKAAQTTKNWFSGLYEAIMARFKFNLYLLSSFIFLSLSGAAFAVSRASQGLEQAFMTRYKTVALMLFVVFYLSLFNVIKPQNWKKYRNLSVVFAVFFSLFSYYASFDDVANYRKFLATTMVNWQNNGRYFYYRNGAASRYPDDHAPITTYQKLPIPPFNYAGFVPGVMKYVNDILFIGRVYYKNYNPPAELEVLNRALFAAANLEPAREQVAVIDEANTIKIDIRNAMIPASQLYGGYYATFVSDKNRLVFVLNNQANKFTTFLATRQYYGTLIAASVSKPELPTGKFAMTIGRLDHNRFKVLRRDSVVVK